MRRVLAPMAVAGLVVLAGCAPSTPTIADQVWEQVELPAGFTGSQLLDVDGRLVVGGSQGEAPAILVADEGGELTAIPVDAGSFYGSVARWYSLIADGSQLRALGGRTGGGHGNPRWSTWVGDLDGLAEQPAQGIEVFGGWRGGGMVGVAVVDDQAVLVGGRAGDAPGLDIAVWLEQGTDWVEQSSTGTALGATAGMLPFPSSVVSDGTRLLITGFTQRLGGGEVRVDATAWVGPPTGPWQRVDLPSTEDESRADAATCDLDRCVVVGRGDDAVLAWSYENDTVRALDVPAVSAGESAVPAPVRWAGATAIVVADGAASQVLTSTDLMTWQQRSGPDGVPVAAASSGSTLFVLAQAADGSVALWRSA